MIDSPDRGSLGMFTPVEWRGTTSVTGDGLVGLSFNTQDGAIIRLKLDESSAKQVAKTLSGALQRKGISSQSPKSSGIPSVDGSTPLEGQKQ